MPGPLKPRHHRFGTDQLTELRRRAESPLKAIYDLTLPVGGPCRRWVQRVRNAGNGPVARVAPPNVDAVTGYQSVAELVIAAGRGLAEAWSGWWIASRTSP